MANEIHYIDSPGQTTIYCILVNKVGQIRRISLGSWDDAPIFSNWDDYSINLTGQANTPFYYASLPSGIGDDIIEVYVFKRVGSTKVPTDTYLGTGSFNGWDGTKEVTLISLKDAGSIGPGSITRTFVIKTIDGVPVGNIKCWVSTDVAGGNVIAGSILSDYSGKVSFLLDPGSYYLWRSSPNYTFNNPQQFVVS